MADIKTQISTDVKEAMRQKDKERLAALRLILASFKQKEVDESIDFVPHDILHKYNFGNIYTFSWDLARSGNRISGMGLR